MKKLLILGATGMLGSAVVKYLSAIPEYEVTATVRSHENKRFLKGIGSVQIVVFDALTMPLDSIYGHYDYVINCIGMIKPYVPDRIRDAIVLNALFPWNLSEWCTLGNMRLIHITTDCVYSGQKGKYVESEVHDAQDAYGKSKSLGECADSAMVLRTSIVGEELHNFSSLLSWTKKQAGKMVQGYRNHFWNGVSTLEYAKVLHKIIMRDFYKAGLFHLFASDDVSKHQLLGYFNEKYNLHLKIEEYDAEPIDRTLRTEKDLCSKLNIPTVRQMIMELDQ